jgi:hypothetical protein
MEEQREPVHVTSTKIAVSLSPVVVATALEGLKLWTMYDLASSNDAKARADKQRIDGQIAQFIDQNAGAIADYWIDLQPVYLNVKVYTTIETEAWMPRTAGHETGPFAGTVDTISGPPEAAERYLGSGLVTQGISDHMIVGHQRILLSHEMDDGAVRNTTMEIAASSFPLPVDRDAARARIVQRIYDIDREMARVQSAIDNFPLELERRQLELKKFNLFGP